MWSRETSTDFEFSYRYHNGPSGDLTMFYNSSIPNGLGVYAIPRVRMAQYSNIDPSEATYGGWAQGAIEVEIGPDQVGLPIHLHHSGMLRAPAYVANFQPYAVPVGANLAASKELVLGPGIRTTGPIYSGSTGQQITDSTGHILSGALNIVAPSQGGLGIDASAFPADKIPYTTSAGNFGGWTLTAFGRDLIDSVDSTAARSTLGAQAQSAELTTIAGLGKTAGNVILANGSTWTSTGISGDASLSGAGALTVNKLSPNDNPIQGFNSQTLSANLTLVANSPRIQHLKTDTATANREVWLGNLGIGREFIIHNIGAAGVNTNLVIKNSTGATELFRLPPGWFTYAVSKGSDTWEFQTGSKHQPFTVTATDVATTATGSHTLLVVPTGLKFFMTSVTFECVSRIGTLTTSPGVSIGDASTSTAIINSAAVTLAQGTYQQTTPKLGATVISGGGTLKFYVNTAAAGTGLTYKLAAHVTGYYR